MNSIAAVEVDGVPVLFAPAPGPMRAGLVFRVGWVDETLPTHGITHLVEHLALHRHDIANYHYNGATTSTTTQFVVEGTQDTVVTFINGICASLRDLPIDRVATEKKILETEAAGRTRAISQEMAMWRYGARDFGIVSFPEWGVRTLTDDHVADWATTRFNRGNAALWIAGAEIPRGLRLDLPDGKRWALPVESSALPVTPAYFTVDASAAVMEARAPRGAAATIYAAALQRALRRELRWNRGLSYTAAATYGTDGRAHATITALVDARPEQMTSAVDCFVDELRKLQGADLDLSEIDTIRALELEALANPDAEAKRLPRRVVDLLAGFPVRTTDELVEGLRHVTSADVRAIARTVNDTALLMVPNNIGHPPAGFEAAPTLSRFSVTGQRRRSRTDSKVTFVQGADGVSLSTQHGPATVLFDECAAMLRWPDGARRLIGNDAITVHIEPASYALPAIVLAAIDDAVSPAAIVDMPPREPPLLARPPLRTRLGASMLPWRARLASHSGRLVLLGLVGVPVVALVIAIVAHLPVVGVVALIWLAIMISAWRQAGE